MLNPYQLFKIMKENILGQKSFQFAIRIVNIYKQLNKQKEFVLSKQVLRSGTSIGANLREAEHAESRSDFIHKLSISLKEVNETKYWLELLSETHYLDSKQYSSLIIECEEILKLLIASIKTSKERLVTKH